MPKKVLNGNNGAVHGENLEPHYQLSLEILAKVKEFWLSQAKDAKADEVTFTRMSVVAYGQWCAIMAVDVGMTQDQFVNVCRAQYVAAYAKAPRFG